MRYFLRRRVPPLSRILLIESGSRHLLDNFLPGLYQNNPGATVDLITCYPDQPRAFQATTGTIYRVADYPDSQSRRAFHQQLKANQYAAAVMICSGEPIMTKWKWLLAAALPVKLLILNENGDYFWCDRSNWRIIRHFILFRAGLSGAGAVTTIARLLLFPFTVAYLVLYTAIVHLRRKVRA
ncbi:MAG: hypothetical protein GY953_58475 [bacterium]|nr:hypothetical protein [bacterium]